MHQLRIGVNQIHESGMPDNICNGPSGIHARPDDLIMKDVRYDSLLII